MAVELYPSEFRISESEQEYGHFKSEDTRDKLYRSALLKYRGSSTSQRIRKRTNIDFKFRLVLQEIVAIFEMICPHVTGNGRLNGINYKVFDNNKADIIIGGLLAPYIVHISYPLSKRQKQPPRYWIEKAYRHAYKVADTAGYFLSPPDIRYGLVVLTVGPKNGGWY